MFRLYVQGGRRLALFITKKKGKRRRKRSRSY